MPFQPGQSGNPSGRPKKQFSLTSTLREFMEESSKAKSGDEIPNRRVLAMKLFSLAGQGDLPAIKFIYDRIDGPLATKPEPVEAKLDDLIAQLGGVRLAPKE